MRIAVGSDHAGFHLKEHVKLALAAAGHDVVDVGTASPRAVDYPRFAAEAARLVGEGDVARAVLACGSGVGVAIVANKVAGVRAVNAHDPSEAEMSRRHNDVNIVTLSGARLGPSEADAIVARLPAHGVRGRPPRPPRRADPGTEREPRRRRRSCCAAVRTRSPCYRRRRRDWRVGGTDHREATHLICRSAWAQSASRRGAPMSELSPDFFNRPLAEVDPEIADAIQHELDRQQRTLEMIASENFVPQAILECQGSVLTNKYAEGYPGKRYYGGCEYVDIIEQLAIDRAKALFGAEHANVQPHAGAQTNAAVYHALLQPGDTIMGLALPHGGHLTHGMKLNVSGRLYDIAPYEVSRETSLIDMDEVERIAHERRPKLILAGWSAYPRFLDFERFRAIADAVGAYLVVDMAHFAGLVGGGRAPQPGALRRRRHLDGAQDAGRRARRRHPVPRGVRQGDQLGRLPGPAGRAARARHRGQGGGLPHRPDRALPRAPAAHGGRRQGAGPGAARPAGARRSTC